MEVKVNDWMKVTSEGAARMTGRKVGDVGIVRMERKESRHFIWLMFRDGVMAPYEPNEIQRIGLSYIPAQRHGSDAQVAA